MVTYNIDNIEVCRVNKEIVRIIFTKGYYKQSILKQSILIINNEIDFAGAYLLPFGFENNEPTLDTIFEVVYLYGKKNK